VHTLLLPFRREGGLEQKTLMAHPLRKWRLERPIDRSLGHLHCWRVVAGNRMRGFQRNLQKVGVRYDARNETESLRLGRSDGTAGKDEIHRKRFSDRMRQPLRPPHTGQDTELDLRLTELGVLGRNNEIAEHREFAATAKRKAANGSDDWLGDGFDFVPWGQKVAHIETGKWLLRHFSDICTSRECARTTGNHNSPDLIIHIECLQGSECLDRNLSVQSVQALRPIQGNEADTIATLDDNRL